VGVEFSISTTDGQIRQKTARLPPSLIAFLMGRSRIFLPNYVLLFDMIVWIELSVAASM